MEGVPLFSGKTNIDAMMDWIDGMDNHFYYKGVLEAQKFKVANSRLGGSALKWWKYVQDERISEGKKPIANWNAMVTKLKEDFLPKDFKI